jgi:hypothetical protein
MKRRRRDKGLQIPDTFEESVQSAFNQHCSQSEIFKNPKDELFTSTHDVQSATWSVNVDRADVWLRMGPALYELAQAMARIKAISTADALRLVETASDAKRKEWRNHARVKAAILAIRAENASAAIERAQEKTEMSIRFEDDHQT